MNVWIDNVMICKCAHQLFAWIPEHVADRLAKRALLLDKYRTGSNSLDQRAPRSDTEC